MVIASTELVDMSVLESGKEAIVRENNKNTRITEKKGEGRDKTGLRK